MKNLIKYTLIATMTLLSITSNAQASKVKHYLSITHKVTDYTKWKLVFDETKSDRTEAGIEDIFVKKDINNTNYITFLAEVKNLAKAKAFTSSTTLKEDMIKAGVASPPEIVYYKAAKEYNAINTSALGTIITHSVKDYAAWMDIYESVEDLRINDGLIDHLILKSLSNENVVTVIGSSLSAAKFNKFMANPDLKLAMEEAGVTSKPIVKILL